MGRYRVAYKNEAAGDSCVWDTDDIGSAIQNGLDKYGEIQDIDIVKQATPTPCPVSLDEWTLEPKYPLGMMYHDPYFGWCRYVKISKETVHGDNAG